MAAWAGHWVKPASGAFLALFTRQIGIHLLQKRLAVMGLLTSGDF
jgi:hypothetical protein